MSSSLDSMRERVLFVPREDLEAWGGLGVGFFEDSANLYSRIVSNHAYEERFHLEDDPSKKQIIPYVVFHDKNTVWVMARKKAQTEARLHGMWSIGVGGHIGEGDSGDGIDAIRVGMMRELHEELRIDCDVNPRFVGFINDDSNPVGQVHLGAVFFAQVELDRLSVRETEKMEGFSESLAQLVEQRNRLESWSSFVLDRLVESLR